MAAGQSFTQRSARKGRTSTGRIIKLSVGIYIGVERGLRSDACITTNIIENGNATPSGLYLHLKGMWLAHPNAG